MTVGLVTATLTLKNPRLPELGTLELKALVDSGSTFLCIPESVREQLALEASEMRDICLADGSRKRAAYVGPVEVRFKERVAFCGALVTGDQVLLGAVPMEDMNLVIAPLTQTLEYSPYPLVCEQRITFSASAYKDR
jgi:clan AA aspartic protease